MPHPLYRIHIIAHSFIQKILIKPGTVIDARKRIKIKGKCVICSLGTYGLVGKMHGIYHVLL